MIDEWAVQSRLRAHLILLDQMEIDPPLPDAREWEGPVFEPPAGQPWMRETMRLSDNRINTTGRTNRLYRAEGIYYVGLFYPRSLLDVEKVAKAAAFNVQKHFEPGYPVDAEGVIKITRADTSASLGRDMAALDPQWFYAPVSVWWYVIANTLTGDAPP